jgi:hypothetical protein
MLKRLIRRARRVLVADVLAEQARILAEIAALRAQLAARDQQFEAVLLTLALAKAAPSRPQDNNNSSNAAAYTAMEWAAE